MKDANHSTLTTDLETLRWRITDTSDLNRKGRPAKVLDAIGSICGMSLVGTFDPAELWAALVSDTRIAPYLAYYWVDCSVMIDFKNPATYYGRQGLNDNQQAIARLHPVLVIATPEDVKRYGVR